MSLPVDTCSYRPRPHRLTPDDEDNPVPAPAQPPIAQPAGIVGIVGMCDEDLLVNAGDTAVLLADDDDFDGGAPLV